MKKTIIIFILLLFTFSSLYSQRNDPILYTKHFFAAKTNNIEYYVFVYNDHFLFAAKTGNRTEVPVRINYNNIHETTDLLIAGNYFLIKLRTSLFGYNLSKLVSSQNNRRNLDDCNALEIIIDNIRSISQYGNDVYYTVFNNSSLYKFTPVSGTRAGTPVPNVNIQANASGSFLQSSVLFFPISEKKRAEYEETKNKVLNNITRYNNIEKESINNQKITEILETIVNDVLKDINNTQVTGRNINTVINNNHETLVYNNFKKHLTGIIDIDLFSDFRLLADLTTDDKVNNTKNAQDIINGINISQDNTANALTGIRTYYENNRNLLSLKPQDNPKSVLESRQQIHRDKILEIRKRWGCGTEEEFKTKNTAFDNIYKTLANTRNTDYKWQTNRNVRTEFNQNYKKIESFNNQISNLLINTAIVPNTEYAYLIGVYENIVKTYPEAGLNNNEIQGEINKLLNYINRYQAAYFNSAREDFNKSNQEIAALTGLITTEETKFNNEVSTAERKKIEALEILVKNYAARYMKEVINNSGNTGSKGSFNKDFKDFFIATENQIIINGYTVNNIKISHENRTNNSGDRYSSSPLFSYPFINIANDSVFVHAGNSIAVYDLRKLNIMEAPVINYTPNQGILYLVKSTDGQYIVTKNGRLISLSVPNNGSALTENILPERVSASDAVIITPNSRKTANEVYILSQNGRVNGKTSETIRFRSCNSDDIFSIRFDNGNYTIQ